jgi:hypothetical protein
MSIEVDLLSRVTLKINRVLWEKNVKQKEPWKTNMFVAEKPENDIKQKKKELKIQRRKSQ